MALSLARLVYHSVGALPSASLCCHVFFFFKKKSGFRPTAPQIAEGFGSKVPSPRSHPLSDKTLPRPASQSRMYCCTATSLKTERATRALMLVKGCFKASS